MVPNYAKRQLLFGILKQLLKNAIKGKHGNKGKHLSKMDYNPLVIGAQQKVKHT